MISIEMRLPMSTYAWKRKESPKTRPTNPDNPNHNQRCPPAFTGSSVPCAMRCAISTKITANTRRMRFTMAEPTSFPDIVKKMELPAQQNAVSSAASSPNRKTSRDGNFQALYPVNAGGTLPNAIKIVEAMAGLLMFGAYVLLNPCEKETEPEDWLYNGAINAQWGESMDPETEYQAMVVNLTPSGVERQIRRRKIADLPPGDILIRVQFSSLNYKDALSASGNRGVTRNYPHTPGIDAAGIVIESASPDFKAGQEVVVMNYDLGTNTPGGYGQYIRVPVDWVMPIPANMTLDQMMVYGTAGLTAALSLYKLEKAGVTPSQGEILVTGATGWVGIFAVAMLALSGYQVVAVTGKQDKAPLLRTLGAEKVIGRDEASDTSDKPLLHASWAGVVDTVGGNYLATAIKSTLPGGVITCCGNVAGPQLNTTVFPFILRGVSLLGVDVGQLPMALRRELWNRIAGVWYIKDLNSLYHIVPLDGLDTEIERILHGQQTGRVVVRVD